jgi:hypothetical protein
MNEYVAVYGSHHIIEPIGYNIVHKIIKQRALVRSAPEQYEIHKIAEEFTSDIMTIPKVYNLVSKQSYTMEYIYDTVKVNPGDYMRTPNLFVALIEFQQFMMERGYWAHGYNVLAALGRYYLVDFSGFGAIDGDYVKFPKNATIHRLCDLQGYFELELPSESEKIDVPFPMDPDLVAII